MTGADVIDRQNERALRVGTAPLRDRYEMEFLAGLSTQTLLRKVADLPSHSILFSPGYFSDGDGQRFAPREVASEIAAVANAPVYGPYNTFIGTGIVGGIMPDYAEVGREAAAAVVSLLDGTPPDAVSTPAKTAATLQVDWRQVQRRGYRRRADSGGYDRPLQNTDVLASVWLHRARWRCRDRFADGADRRAAV